MLKQGTRSAATRSSGSLASEGWVRCTSPSTGGSPARRRSRFSAPMAQNFSAAQTEEQRTTRIDAWFLIRRSGWVGVSQGWNSSWALRSLADQAGSALRRQFGTEKERWASRRRSGIWWSRRLHRSAGSRFGLEPVIEDLARTEDRLTARFALRRLEYRSDSVRLGGHALPWSALPLPIGAGLLGVLVAASLASRSKALGMPASV